MRRAFKKLYSRANKFNISKAKMSQDTKNPVILTHPIMKLQYKSSYHCREQVPKDLRIVYKNRETKYVEITRSSI